MFLSLDILFEYWIEHVISGPLYVVFRFSTRIFYRGVPGLVTDCPCGIWRDDVMTPCHGNAFRITGLLYGDRWIPLTKDQLCGTLMFSLLLAKSFRTNNRIVGDMRRYGVHVMSLQWLLIEPNRYPGANEQIKWIESCHDTNRFFPHSKSDEIEWTAPKS